MTFQPPVQHDGRIFVKELRVHMVYLYFEAMHVLLRKCWRDHLLVHDLGSRHVKDLGCRWLVLAAVSSRWVWVTLMRENREFRVILHKHIIYVFLLYRIKITLAAYAYDCWWRVVLVILHLGVHRVWEVSLLMFAVSVVVVIGGQLIVPDWFDRAILVLVRALYLHDFLRIICILPFVLML